MEREEVSMQITMTVDEACDQWNLHPALRRNLKSEGISDLFEIQTKAIPQIMDCDKFSIARDITICAPTGSGKTLVYVIPIIQALVNRIVPRIRALIVVPSKDLVQQVKFTFDAYTRGTDLRVGVLFGSDSSLSYDDSHLWIDDDMKESDILNNEEMVDILISTPGRLVELIKDHPSIDLHNLQYLVVDEADKLLLQSFDNWIHVLYSHMDETPHSFFKNTNQGYFLQSACNHSSLPCYSLQNPRGTRKILLSATLNTESNINIEKLRLANILVYTVNGMTKENVFTVPSGLHEEYLVVEAIRKPLALFRVVDREMIGDAKKVLVFCNNIDTVHRVFLFMQLMMRGSPRESLLAEYSSKLTPNQRNETMRAFQSGEKRILISSDTIARGIDIPGITAVINYDIAKYAETFIHRSGRTARALKEGKVVTLVRPNQISFFRYTMKKIMGSHSVEGTLEEDKDLDERYVKVMQELKEVYLKEKMKKASV